MANMGTHQQIVDAIQSLKVGAEWNMSGQEYTGLTWLDGVITKPTEQEILDQIAL